MLFWTGPGAPTTLSRVSEEEKRSILVVCSLFVFDRAPPAPPDLRTFSEDRRTRVPGPRRPFRPGFVRRAPLRAPGPCLHGISFPPAARGARPGAASAPARVPCPYRARAALPGPWSRSPTPAATRSAVCHGVTEAPGRPSRRPGPASAAPRWDGAAPRRGVRPRCAVGSGSKEVLE